MRALIIGGPSGRDSGQLQLGRYSRLTKLRFQRTGWRREGAKVGSGVADPAKTIFMMNDTRPGLKGLGPGLAILPSGDVTPGSGSSTARRRAWALIGRSRVGAAAGGLAS